MFRKKSSRKQWVLAAAASSLAAVALAIGRVFWRRRAPVKMGRGPLPPEAYGLEEAPGFDAAAMGLPYDSSKINEPGQVPVTAQRAAKRAAAGARRGTARAYDRPSNGPEREKRPFPWLVALIPLVLLGVVLGMSLLDRRPARAQVVTVPGGDVEAGRQAIGAWGCGSCHTIPGVAGAYGKVGPELDQMAEQTYIAGMLPNTPDNLMRWIMDPQEIQPGNAMPDTGVGLETARNMAAYLYSIR